MKHSEYHVQAARSLIITTFPDSLSAVILQVSHFQSCGGMANRSESLELAFNKRLEVMVQTLAEARKGVGLAIS